MSNAPQDSSAARLESAEGSAQPLSSPYSIGRSTENVLPLDDTQVSRQHCVLERDPGGHWWLTDLQSTNGTYLNGKPVSEPSILRKGDAIGIGEQLFFYYGPSPQPEPSTPTAKEPALEPAPVDPHGTHPPLPSNTSCWLVVGDAGTAEAAELSPQELTLKQGHWLNQSRELIENASGTLNKSLGDGYFAFFEEATIEPLDIGKLLKKLHALSKNLHLNSRLFLHHGNVHVGKDKGQPGLSGPAVNYIFRCEKLSTTLEEPLLISDAAAARLRGCALKSLGCHTVAGFAGENAFFTLDTTR